MTKPLAGMIVDILRGSHGDFTNDGVTSPSRGYRDAYLVGPGVAEVFNVDASRRPVLKLVKRMIGGRPYFHAEPIDPPPTGEIGWMAGGNFIYTSDSRFNDVTAGYPIAIHDRKETVEQYAALSI